VIGERLGWLVTQEDLGLVATLTNDALQVPWVSQTVLDSLVTFTGSDLMFSRRELAGLAVGAPLLAVSHRFLGSAPLSQALPGRAPRVGSDDVAAVEALVAHLRALDAAHGGNLFRRAAVAQLKGVAELLQAGQDRQVSRQLYTVAADLAQLVG